ncbi:MAG TPA: stage III sporulation protein AF [Lachnospiraceae bacterium]|nr:stage III sporulation protein AF [Lachnospiraceae bacterium]
MKKRKITIVICLLLIVAEFFAVAMLLTIPVLAALEDEQVQEQKSDSTWTKERLMEELDFGEVEQELKKLFPREKITFTDLLSCLFAGEPDKVFGVAGDMIRDRFFYELSVNRRSMVQILAIALVAAVITNFSGMVKNKQIAEISFYLLYLLLITICLNAFQVTLDAVQTSIGELTGFIQVLGPVYFLAVAFSSGLNTSMVFYHLILVLIYLVELVVLQFLIPLIHVYIMMRVLDNLSPEAYLSRFSELLELVIRWILKALLTGVAGISLIQGLLVPVLDSLKRGTLMKGMEMIPGIGDIASGAGEIVIASAVLIKNGIGIGAAVVCILICMTPVIQTGLLVLLYKLSAALLQPVSDKRIVSMLGGIGDGMQILMKMVMTVAVLFLLTIAIVSATA